MRSQLALRYAGAIAFAAVIAACAPMPPEAPKPVAAPSAEDTLRARAKEQLAAGIKLYEAGDYDGAQKSLAASLDHGLLSKTDQAIARKHLAFIHCLGAREAQCTEEFRKAFEIDPTFALTPAEDGHPVWGPVYRNVRTQLIAEREAAQGKPRVPLAKAEQLLADGMVKYDAGEFEAALKLLEAATKEGLKEKADEVKAMKHTAFCLCLLGKYAVCRAHFVKIYDIDPDFDLTPAEAGHPSWTKTFAGAKAQAKRAQADKAKKKAP
jgi:tetratricopeptide (TPR) repeat protein